MEVVRSLCPRSSGRYGIGIGKASALLFQKKKKVEATRRVATLETGGRTEKERTTLWDSEK